ncbi:replicative DNA helicase [Glacieibacterium frigidum]|uniref:Replicative DNA helicase n=1 Tax=Glacieibacterium frigidum TaxID=2593303 RepID=A0A552UFD4_9SPHN|nr:replicative DNA helicase [Glacieibacterium frigidum]TRW16933.1 replicative DNA helicase [Glacieibacterium frigidum]
MIQPLPLRVVPPVPETAILPQNLEAEAALLGALMIDNRLVEDVMLKLRPEHFHEALHGRIYEKIVALADRNMVATPVTLKPLFDADPAMADVGGTGYLARLTEQSGALIAAKDFAQQIYDLALLREMIRVGREMAAGAFDTGADVSPLKQIEDAELALYKVAEQGEVAGAVKTFAQATREAVEMADRAMKSGGHLSGYTTGLDALNAKIGGLHKSDLVILAGRPAMGKTALATNIAFACAQRAQRDAADGIDEGKRSGAGVAFFSLEMSSDQLATRVLAEQSDVNSESLRMGKISQDEFNRLARAAGALSELPFYIDDTPALSIAALRTRARRLKRQRGVGVIVVDYLQLLQGSAKTSENRVQEISEITRGLKTLAKELQVPVLALSQLSRAVENREDKRPQLADLRESGTIEQDADIVLFVYREEYYHALKQPDIEDGEKHAKWKERAEKLHGLAEVIVAKQRHGSTGTVPLTFHKSTTKFADRADDAFLPERYE